MSDKKRKSVTLDPDNAQYLTEHDNASALVNDLVENYRKHGDRGVVGLKLQRKQKEAEAQSAQERADRLFNEGEELDRLIKEFEREESAELKEARSALAETPKDPDNPAIERWAKELGMTPTELLEEL